MKYYNNFNEMFVSNSSSKRNANVFNYYQPWERFADEVRWGIEDAVDEWFATLTDSEKEKLMNDGFQWVLTGDGNALDHIYDTKAYKQMWDKICGGEVDDDFFELVRNEPFVRERAKDYYNLDLDDEEALRKEFPIDYKKAVIEDAVYWLGEEGDYGGVPGDGALYAPVMEKIEYLRDHYWEEKEREREAKQQKFDFYYE